MSDDESNKKGKSSALLSIASAYSDSESSEETVEDSSKNLGSFVESLRAKQREEISGSSAVEDTSTANKDLEPERQQSVTKIVRLDSGKVVKISTSPVKSDSLGNEATKKVVTPTGLSLPQDDSTPSEVKENISEEKTESSFKSDEPILEKETVVLEETGTENSEFEQPKEDILQSVRQGDVSDKKVDVVHANVVVSAGTESNIEKELPLGEIQGDEPMEVDEVIESTDANLGDNLLKISEPAEPCASVAEEIVDSKKEEFNIQTGSTESERHHADDIKDETMNLDIEKSSRTVHLISAASSEEKTIEMVEERKKNEEKEGEIAEMNEDKGENDDGKSEKEEKSVEKEKEEKTVEMEKKTVEGEKKTVETEKKTVEMEMKTVETEKKTVEMKKKTVEKEDKKLEKAEKKEKEHEKPEEAEKLVEKEEKKTEKDEKKVEKEERKVEREEKKLEKEEKKAVKEEKKVEKEEEKTENKEENGRKIVLVEEIISKNKIDENQINKENSLQVEAPPQVIKEVEDSELVEVVDINQVQKIPEKEEKEVRKDTLVIRHETEPPVALSEKVTEVRNNVELISNSKPADTEVISVTKAEPSSTLTQSLSVEISSKKGVEEQLNIQSEKSPKEAKISPVSQKTVDNPPSEERKLQSTIEGNILKTPNVAEQHGDKVPTQSPENKVEPQKIILDRSTMKTSEMKSPPELKPLPQLKRIKTKPTILKRSEPYVKKPEPAENQSSSVLKKMEDRVRVLETERRASESMPSGPVQSILEANLKKPPTSGPIKLKRNFGETSSTDFSQLEKKLRTEPSMKSEPPKVVPARSKTQFTSSEEIREILAKRLGSGLDISIIPAKPKGETSLHIGELEIIARPPEPSASQRIKSPPKMIVPNTSLSPPSPYQQKLALAQQSYQSSFTNMISSSQSSFQTPQKSPGRPRILLKDSTSPPFGAQISQKKSPVSSHPEMKKTLPLIIRKSDYEPRKVEHRTEEVKKVMPVKVCLKEDGSGSSVVAKKLIGQSEISTDSSCSSEFPSSALPFDSSSSSQENATFPEGGIDFENIIGSSVVCKDTGLPPVPENVETNEETKPNLDTIQGQQTPAVVTPVPLPTPTPRKRGRPRKSTVQAMSNPNPVVATFPPEGLEEFPSTGVSEKQLGRAERRRRREAIKVTTVPKKTKYELKKEGIKKEVMDGEGNEVKEEPLDGEEAIRETPKKRFIPKPPLKKKKRKGLFTVKKKATTLKKKDSEKENVQNFEEETRMSASEGPTSVSSKGVNQGDESQGSSATTEGQTNRNINKKGRMEITTDSCKPVTVQQIVEYFWPPVSSLSHGEKPEGLMIQEQISEYLGVKSFKRKYPTIKRRPVDMEERNYLQENGFVSENMCDMGLTAVYSADIIEIMYNDFPNKFEEFRKYSREKKAREQKALREKQAAERADMDPRKEALEATLQWNTEFNKARQ